MRYSIEIKAENSMTKWEERNITLTGLAEITNTVGTTALTAGFILTACGVIATSTALAVLPYLLLAVFIGAGILQIVNCFTYASKGDVEKSIMTGFMGSLLIYSSLKALSTAIPFCCIMLGLLNLLDAAAECENLREIKKEGPENIAVISDREEALQASLVRAISWFIVAASVAWFTPVAIAGGLSVIAVTHFYSLRNSLFFCKKRDAAMEENEDAINSTFEKPVPLTFWDRMKLRSQLPRPTNNRLTHHHPQ
jgi:hypothetical protein